jgi:hypothetical protein
MGGRADYMAAHFVLDFKRVRPEGYLFSKPVARAFGEQFLARPPPADGADSITEE